MHTCTDRRMGTTDYVHLHVSYSINSCRRRSTPDTACTQEEREREREREREKRRKDGERKREREREREFVRKSNSMQWRRPNRFLITKGASMHARGKPVSKTDRQTDRLHGIPSERFEWLPQKITRRCKCPPVAGEEALADLDI